MARYFSGTAPSKNRRTLVFGLAVAVAAMMAMVAALAP